MIISSGRKYIFVHIPKTGGTSVALALEDRAMKDDIMLGDTPKALKRRRKLRDVQSRGRLWKHSTLADIEGVIPQDSFADYFCFALVRNPWDRAVSYYHWLKDQSFEHPAVMLAKTLDFEPFILHPVILASFRTSPAAHYLTDSSGTCQASLFVRLEHLRTDIAALERHLGFELDIPHTNQSERRRDWRGYFSESSRKGIAEACGEDIERFGYRF